MKNVKSICKFSLLVFLFVLGIGAYFGMSSLKAYTPSKTVEGIDAFPAEYQAKLRELSKVHSNWKFIAVYTYLDWNDVIKNEMVDGRSLVSTSFPDSWKKDGRQIEPGWVNASKMAVEYSVDPRNFLNEEKIFQFELSHFNSSAHTKEVVEEVLKGTDMYKNEEYKNNNQIASMGTTYADIIYQAAQSSDVSASHVASRIIQENGGKVYTNRSINGSTSGYEGYYNFMNIGAYCTDNCGRPYIHGLQYAKNNGWTSPQIAIQAASDRIKKVWVNYGQNTVYFEKWDVNYVSGAIGLYTSQYMTNITAPSTESTMMYNAYRNAGKLDSSFVFYIPVYLNMPNMANEATDDNTLVYLDDPSDQGVDDTFLLRQEASNSSNVVKEFTFQDDNKVSENTPYIVVRKKKYSFSLYDYVEIYDRAEKKAYYGYMAKEYLFEYPKNALKDTTPPKITLDYVYDPSNNTVKVIAKSDEILKNNKPTWNYGADQKTTDKVFYDNTSYSTTFYDEFNNVTTVNIQVTQVDKQGPKITVNYIQNSDGTVTVHLISNEVLKEDKASGWKLSTDKKTYIKTFKENTTYTTIVHDQYGNETKVDLKVDQVVANTCITYTYHEKDNTVIATVFCENGFKETKPTWSLSEDKKTYTKVFESNTLYKTLFVDLYGNKKEVEVKIDQIKDYIITKQYRNSDNTVLVKVSSTVGFQKIKPTWTLSNDKKIYSKVYHENGEYCTLFTDLNGKVEELSFQISEIDCTGPKITIQKEYDANQNVVKVKAISNEKLGKTKPTWTLDENAMVYEKVYDKNGNYQTKIQDIYGNESQFSFTVDEIQGGFTVEKDYDKSKNTVLVRVKSKSELQEIKPTWTLDESRKVYQKEYAQNGTYLTKFIDINGHEEMVSFRVDEIDTQGPKVTIQKEYDADQNVVKVKAISNEKLSDTKPTWTLDKNAMVYEKIYDKNGNYQTNIKDIYGNESYFSFTIDEIQSGFTVEKVYDKNKNTVLVRVLSKVTLQEIKPTWKLDESKKVYQKEYTQNGTYTTQFMDSNGKAEQISFQIDEIRENHSVITIHKSYDLDSQSVTVTANSNIALLETMPNWTLDESKMQYRKVYTEFGEFTANFKDCEENETSKKIQLEKMAWKQLYHEDRNTVTVSITTSKEFQKVKPTWTLSSDGKTYTKEYSQNGTYTTAFTYGDGEIIDITFSVQKVDQTGPQITLTPIYHLEDSCVTMVATSNEKLGKTKPTWTLSEDQMSYTKVYNQKEKLVTSFQDRYGNETSVTVDVDQVTLDYELEKTVDKEKNQVMVSIKNNDGFQEVKPTWTLSSDKRIYTKIYSQNGTYVTSFTNTDGTVNTVSFQVTGVK